MGKVVGKVRDSGGKVEGSWCESGGKVVERVVEKGV